MQEILTLIRESSPTIIILVILGYFLKLFLEKKVESIVARVDEIGKTSLEVKKELRGEERGELVAFRVSVEKWEDFLQTALFDFAMASPSKADVALLYEKDKELFLDVKISIVKACVYLRKRDLEIQLMDAIIKIRKNYYPIISDTLPRLIDLQAQLIPIENKLSQFQKSNMQDMSYAPTEKDREDNSKLQAMMTEEMKKYSDFATKDYTHIAEQMYDLKNAINQYIYRPINDTAINKD